MRLFIKTVWALSVVAVCWASLTPQPFPMPEVEFNDKIGHAAAYAWLAFLPWAGFPDRRNKITAVLFTIGLGIALEFAQSFIPNRFGSAWDVVANVSGTGLGVMVATGVIRRLTLKTRKESSQ